MGKMYKIALAILYMAQIIVLVREPAAHLYKTVIEKEEPERAAAPVIVDLRQVLKQTFRAFGLGQCLAAAPLSKPDDLTVHADREAHQHTPEDKQALVRRLRRRYHYRNLVLNLFPLIRKKACPVSEPAPIADMAAVCRAVLFPPHCA